MAHQGRSVLLEDDRFIDIKSIKKKALPNRLIYVSSIKDYLINEAITLKHDEVAYLKSVGETARAIIIDATNKIIAENRLGEFGIPNYMVNSLIETWNERELHPFMLGRFDISGGLDRFSHICKIIEINADTCTTLPETILWQKAQLDASSGFNYSQFNSLEKDVNFFINEFKSKAATYFELETGELNILGTSLGHPEDESNIFQLLDNFASQGTNTYYRPLQEITFSETDGIFFENSPGQYLKADILLKMIPWDWIFVNEPNLGKELAKIYENKQAIIINPPYTSLWQNKKFLAYITEHFPSNNVFAATYLRQPSFGSYVQKPILGRMGENISIYHDNKLSEKSKGDYENQEMIYQEYCSQIQDKDNNTYQIGLFYNSNLAPSAINFRGDEGMIVTENCEFVSHLVR